MEPRGPLELLRVADGVKCWLIEKGGTLLRMRSPRAAIRLKEACPSVSAIVQNTRIHDRISVHVGGAQLVEVRSLWNRNPVVRA
jgi:hypothetical protein